MPDNVLRFQIGEFTCYPVADGDLVYPRGVILAGAADDELAALYPEQMTIPYTALLVDTGAYRILVDTGAGPLAPTTGRLLDSLRAARLDPDTVDLVVLSHAHPDHIGGNLTADGAVAFPHARFLMSRPEFEFWTAEATQAKLAAGQLCGIPALDQLMAQWVRTYLPPIQDRLDLLERETEIAPGVQALPTFGHTPGHLCLLASSGRQQLLYAGDAIIHPAQVSRPEWNTIFEVDRSQAEQTRRELLDRAAADRCLLFGFHFPFPGCGRVARKGSGYTWEAESLAG